MNRINVLSYLDETYQKYPGKIAFSSENGSVTFSQLYHRSRAAGSYLAGCGYYKKPIRRIHAKVSRYDQRISRSCQEWVLLCSDR